MTARGSELGGRRPLPVALTKSCVIRAKALSALEDAGVRFVLAVESSDVRAVEAAVAADRGVHAMIVDDLPPSLELVGADAGLPSLPAVQINLHVADLPDADVALLGHMLESAFGA